MSDRNHDRDQNAKRAPGRAGREGEERGNHEDGGRKEERGGGTRLHQTLDELRSLKHIAADTGQSPGEHKNHIRGKHHFHAFNEPIHIGLEGHHLAAEEHDERHDVSTEAGPDESGGSGGVAERGEHGVELGILAPVAARVKQTEDREANESDDRDDHVGNRAFFPSPVKSVRLHHTGAGAVIDSFHGALFKGLHRTDVVACPADKEGKTDREQRVEVPRNGGNKRGEIIFKSARGLKRGADSGSPGRDRGDDADRGRGRIDEIGELRAGNAVRVRHRTHHRAGREAGEVVINEDADAETGRRHQGAAARSDFAEGPVSVGLGGT